MSLLKDKTLHIDLISSLIKRAKILGAVKLSSQEIKKLIQMFIRINRQNDNLNSLSNLSKRIARRVRKKAKYHVWVSELSLLFTAVRLSPLDKDVRFFPKKQKDVDMEITKTIFVSAGITGLCLMVLSFILPL